MNQYLIFSTVIPHLSYCNRSAFERQKVTDHRAKAEVLGSDSENTLQSTDVVPTDIAEISADSCRPTPSP
ncbi:hypothetical protein HMPREF3226_00206 [Prevotella corporis]|uniref:Uncharacterized protein n=1 Tax=Prevotella corporis TaxID=28128 RepID=A0A133QN38_9BACT|nr:hypothetical protein HMPREF3226_00206 [Prevotella corporis]